MNYSAVVPSKDIKSVKFSVGYLIEHSLFLKEVLIYWNGSHSDFLELETWSEDLMKHNPAKICLFESLTKGVYQMYNNGVKASTQDHVLLFNDDMYFPPKWDNNWFCLENGKIHESVYTFELVESGYVDVNSKNIHKDFGKTIDSFNKEMFDIYANKGISFSYELGWYMPVIFPKWLFIDSGCFPINPEFPHPNDRIFFELLKTRTFIRWVKIHSSVYHFQRLSQRISKETGFPVKLNLCCGNDKREGYLNVDIENSDYDLDLSEGKIALDDNYFEEILFHHALEHFRFPIARLLLEEIYRILKPEGYVDIRVPDLELAIEDLQLGYSQKPDSCHALMRIYGKNDCEEQVHKWGYFLSTLTDELKKFSFRIHQIQLIATDEIAVRAHKI